eukprot:EG_transcript_10480
MTGGPAAPPDPPAAFPAASATHDNAAYAWWRSLGAPQCVAAPMVDGSELPFRLLCRRYGAQLAYSPMLKAPYVIAANDPYLAEHFTTCPEDRPLIVQLCGNTSEELVAAARLLAPYADAIDLNLGCPQTVARREHFGAFLLDDLPLVRRLVTALVEDLPIPVTCKIRRFPDPHHTVAFAQALVECGCQLLAVHGRTRDQKKEFCSVADWDVVKLVKDSVNVPVLVNGNVLLYEDIATALRYTGCDGAMVAEALLWDPRLFSNPNLPLLTGRAFALRPPADGIALGLAAEYLDLCHAYPTRPDIMKRHMWWLLHHALPAWPRMTDVLHYEGLEDSATYWRRVEGMVADRRGALAMADTADIQQGAEANEELRASLLQSPPPTRPLLPHLAPEEPRVNEYKREVRAERRQATDQLASEDFDGFSLFGDE